MVLNNFSLFFWRCYLVKMLVGSRDPLIVWITTKPTRIMNTNINMITQVFSLELQTFSGMFLIFLWMFCSQVCTSSKYCVNCFLMFTWACLILAQRPVLKNLKWIYLARNSCSVHFAGMARKRRKYWWNLQLRCPASDFQHIADRVSWSL